MDLAGKQSPTAVWGILSTASIARRCVVGIRSSARNSVRAVASRDLAKAQAFASDLCIPIAYGSYDELLADPEITCVYIPLPTSLHHEYVIKAAEAGKHVLCDKPAAVNSKQLEEMIRACKEHQVLFMDGVHFMHHPRMAAIRSLLSPSAVSSSIGSLRHIHIMFSFMADDNFFKSNIRVSRDLEPLGVMGDLGVYAIRFILVAVAAARGSPDNLIMPRQVKSSVLKQTADGVFTEMEATLYFDDIVASCFLSFHAFPCQHASLIGSDGMLMVDDFSSAKSLPAKMSLTRSVDGKRSSSEMEFPVPMSQMESMFDKFSQLVVDGRREEWPVWAQLSLATQRVMDMCMESAK
jgi:predicted dehydrogenase